MDFEPQLDLAPFMADRRGPARPYTLFGVLVHHGHSLHAGHYVAFVRGPNGLWHQMDDASVSQVGRHVIFCCNRRKQSTQHCCKLTSQQ